MRKFHSNQILAIALILLGAGILYLSNKKPQARLNIAELERQTTAKQIAQHKLATRVAKKRSPQKQAKPKAKAIQPSDDMETLKKLAQKFEQKNQAKKKKKKKTKKKKKAAKNKEKKPVENKTANVYQQLKNYQDQAIQAAANVAGGANVIGNNKDQGAVPSYRTTNRQTVKRQKIDWLQILREEERGENKFFQAYDAGKISEQAYYAAIEELLLDGDTQSERKAVELLKWEISFTSFRRLVDLSRQNELAAIALNDVYLSPRSLDILHEAIKKYNYTDTALKAADYIGQIAKNSQRYIREYGSQKINQELIAVANTIRRSRVRDPELRQAFRSSSKIIQENIAKNSRFAYAQ